jgi:hypothetical protein
MGLYPQWSFRIDKYAYMYITGTVDSIDKTEGSKLQFETVTVENAVLDSN